MLLQKTTTLYSELASRIIARQNAQEAGNKDWYLRHDNVIDQIRDILDDSIITIEDVLPSTSFRFTLRGLVFDGEERLSRVFYLVCSASLINDFDVKITGYARETHGDYLHDTLSEKLARTIRVTTTDDDDIISEDN